MFEGGGLERDVKEPKGALDIWILLEDGFVCSQIPEVLSEISAIYFQTFPTPSSPASPKCGGRFTGNAFATPVPWKWHWFLLELAGKQGFLLTDKSGSWQGKISGKPMFVPLLPSKKMEGEEEGAKTNPVPPVIRTSWKRKKKTLVTSTTPMHQINEGSICFFRRSSNPGEPWDRCTESWRSLQQRWRGRQRLLGAGEHWSLVAQKWRIQTHLRALLPLENPVLFCFCVTVVGKGSVHPHGFVASQQDTWQVRNGEEEGRCSEGGREAEKVEEDRRICSKQASYTLHTTHNVWDTAGEPHLSQGPATPPPLRHSWVPLPQEGMDRSFTVLGVRHWQLSLKNLSTSCTSDFFLQERPRSSQGHTCCELLTQPQTRAGGSPAQDPSHFLVPAFPSKIWALSTLLEGPELPLFCGRTFQEFLRIIPQTLTDKGWRVGGKDLII